MSRLALGIMSGTSGDGVSLALADFSDQGFRLIGYKTFPYLKALTQKIANPGDLSLSQISALNFELGELFSRAALKFLKDLRISPAQVCVIGSHGQTIFHGPAGQPPSTFQIGESAVLAERTGIDVVSNFRERDIAAGGEGAPLIPYFDRQYFGSGPIRSLLNIGGISNITLVGKSVEPIAFDIGPGNCLMDWVTAKLTNGRKSYDKDGSLARKGTIDFNAVKQMASHPYFSKRPPKSTGRELFNEKFIPKKLITKIMTEPENVLATLNYFTAFAIHHAHTNLVSKHKSPEEVIVSGGGVFNKTLINHLRALFSPVPVTSIAEYGIHPQAKEPLAFAFFAYEAVRGRTNHMPQGTGAVGPRILGKITPGKKFKGIK